MCSDKLWCQIVVTLIKKQFNDSYRFNPSSQVNKDTVESTSCLVEMRQEKDESGSPYTGEKLRINPTAKKRILCGK